MRKFYVLRRNGLDSPGVVLNQEETGINFNQNERFPAQNKRCMRCEHRHLTIPCTDFVNNGQKEEEEEIKTNIRKRSK